MRSIQLRLLLLAAAFVSIYATALTLSPAARARSWQVSYRWDHWLGWLVWIGVFWLIHRASTRRGIADPYLIPLMALLSGWGLFTIWRLYPFLGLRQTLWLLVCGVVFTLGLRFSPLLDFLRRYKYFWLSSGLALTALTLIFGANPLGIGPRLWLGCCGIYFQPSEPLKLLLIVYLAAYLAEWAGSLSAQPSTLSSQPSLQLLAPTLVMASLALALMLAQRDLGTGSILLFLYAVVVYVASGRQRFLLYGLLIMGVAALLGYTLFDVVRLRVDAWLNPWLDPSGRSYQIVQSLLAVANGGLFGRGPGMGSPGLVPVAHSDFIFAAVAEETGLVGIIALFGVLLVLAARGLRIALLAADPFRRLLAAGLTAYLCAQSVLIIGGNLRLLPLTGVTLPLVSYGGSSLLVSFASLLLLLRAGEPSPEDEPGKSIEQTGPHAIQPSATVTMGNLRPYFHLAGFLFAGLAAAALAAGWWAFVRGPALLTRTDNPRRTISDRIVRRGSLLDRNNTPLAQSVGVTGEWKRQYLYPALSPLIGYTHPVYGQAGLEASLDAYLRGLQGNSGLSIWWNHLLYGQPPPGLDVRLSLDLDLQRTADELLSGSANPRGALVLLDAQSGEILAMASHPTFDANLLDQDGERLLADDAAPLFNRAVLGLYPAQDAVNSLLPGLNLAHQVVPTPRDLGLFTAPAIHLPTATGSSQDDELQASPLQMALIAATISNGGMRPAPQLVLAVDTPQAGWVVLDAFGVPQLVFDRPVATSLAADFSVEPFWQQVITTSDGEVTWYLGGTLPGWQGVPLAVAVLIEGDDQLAATSIGRGVLDAAVSP